MSQPTPRSEVYAAIDGEREYQLNLWKNETTSSGGKHSILEFLNYIRDYTDEAIHNLCRITDDVAVPEARHSLRKIGALAVAAMEQNGAVPRARIVPDGEDLTKHGINPGG